MKAHPMLPATGPAVMSRHRLRGSLRTLHCGLFFIGMGFAVNAAGFVLDYSDLSTGYSNCSYRDNGNGTSSLQLSIDFKQSAGHSGKYPWQSRGILLYAYDRYGRLSSSTRVSNDVKLDGTRFQAVYFGAGYTMYHGTTLENTSWRQTAPFTATVTFSIYNISIEDWPALAVRAGNFTAGDDVGEVAGVAYLSPATKNGKCQIVINPELPPPPMDTVLTLTAPDWNLGELSRGEETVKTFTSTQEQLCFNYAWANHVAYQKFIINATNTNGLSTSGRYRLRSLEDSTHTVPYTVSLANNTDTVVLPNPQNRVFSLSTTGRTCFVPTFTAFADKKAKDGAYSDVLTFTVVAKP